MRSLLRLFIFCLAALLVAPPLTAYWAYRNWHNAGPLPSDKDVIIPRGDGVAAIADRLQSEQIIRNATMFKIATRLGGDQSALKAGEYEFPAHAAMRDVIAKLAKGDIVDRKITVPEGRTSWQIVQIVNQAPALSGSVIAIPADGSLLPETYAYTRDQDRNAVIRDMQAAMDKTLKTLWSQRAADLPFDTMQQALTLAAIVEKETGIPSERARVAGVFINRLKAGIPLQSDPTVIYAMTKGLVKEDGQGPLGRRLFRGDLEKTDSPYNTYKHAGLPPGPIANPGRAAIEAVLHPEKHDFLYFVADGSGGHVFASTLAEHTKNVAAWRQMRRQQGN